MALDTADRRFSALGLAGGLANSVVFAIPDGTISAGDRIQLLGLYRGLLGAPTITVSPAVISISVPTPSVSVGLTIAYNTEPGERRLYTAANWGSGISMYFETTVRAISGTVYARVWDDTLGVEVAGSELSTMSTSFVRLRSAALTLTDGSEYVIQLGVPLPGNQAMSRGGRLIGF